MCIATCVIFQSSTIAASAVGLAVALYISVSEYWLTTYQSPGENAMPGGGGPIPLEELLNHNQFEISIRVFVPSRVCPHQTTITNDTFHLLFCTLHPNTKPNKKQDLFNIKSLFYQRNVNARLHLKEKYRVKALAHNVSARLLWAIH